MNHVWLLNMDTEGSSPRKSTCLSLQFPSPQLRHFLHVACHLLPLGPLEANVVISEVSGETKGGPCYFLRLASQKHLPISTVGAACIFNSGWQVRSFIAYYLR